MIRRWPIGARLVLAVAASMAVVLVGAAAFVFWRVEYALDRRLDQDLAGYHRQLITALQYGQAPPSGRAGLLYEVTTEDGAVVSASRSLHQRQLLTAEDLAGIAGGQTLHRDLGALFSTRRGHLRLRAKQVSAPSGRLVAVVAIGRDQRDEALRELVAQLAIASLLALVAAGYVGYRVIRAALRPVDRYRRQAAALADGASGVRLPVPSDRDDELTRLGHSFNRMLDHLEASAERERRFIADASHELRAPLTLLRAEIDLALHRPRPAAELRSALHAIDADVRKLIDLADALLDLEQLDSGERLAPAETDLRSLVASGAEPYLRAAGRQDRRVVTNAPEGVVVEVDAEWLRRALGNLVDNALRHGSGDVQVDAEVHDGDLAISVRDHGAGFPPDFLPHALQRFTRPDASRHTPGTGLGLALVASVAAAHHGTVSVANLLDGAEVTMVLPATRAATVSP